MDDVQFIWFAIAALMAAFVMRRLFGGEGTELPEGPFEEGFSSTDERAAFLNDYAGVDRDYTLPPAYLPLNAAVAEFLTTYESLELEDEVAFYDRALLDDVYADDPGFLQIGEWADGSAVLIRKGVDDPRIYVDDAEPGEERPPRVLAASLDAYLKAVAAWGGVAE